MGREPFLQKLVFVCDPLSNSQQHVPTKTKVENPPEPSHPSKDWVSKSTFRIHVLIILKQKG